MPTRKKTPSRKSSSPPPSLPKSSRRAKKKRIEDSDNEEDSDTSTTRKRKRRVENTSGDDSVDEDDQPKKKKKSRGILDDLEQRRKPARGKKIPKAGLAGFKYAARFLTVSHDISPAWYQVLCTGIAEDGLEDARANVPEDEDERKDLLRTWELLKLHVPNFDDNIQEIVDADYLDPLVSEMNRSTSDQISQDIRDMKPFALRFAKRILQVDDFDPPIDEDAKKSQVRGWNHPQIARLLCTPIKLKEFDGNPEEFTLKVLENAPGYKINQNHFPSFFYTDLGESASQGPQHVADGLFGSIMLVAGWILIFLGKETLSKWSSTSAKDAFKVKKVGKAWVYGMKEVTPRSIAYVCSIMRHSLSACDDWRCDDGAIDKAGAFKAVVNIFENPQYAEPLAEWIELTMKMWNDEVKWMLPDRDKYELDEEDDPDSSLLQMQEMFGIWAKEKGENENENENEKEKAEDNSGGPAPSSPSSKQSTPSSDNPASDASDTTPASDNSSSPPSGTSSSPSSNGPTSTPPSSDNEASASKPVSATSKPSSTTEINAKPVSSSKPGPKVISFR